MWTEVNKYSWQVQAVLLNSQFPYGMQRFNGQISLHPTSLHTSPACITVTVELVHLHRWNEQLEIPAASTPPARGTNTPAGTPQWMGHCSQPDCSCSASPWPHTDVILHLLHHCTSLPQSQPDYVGFHFCLSIQALNSQQFGSL